MAGSKRRKLKQYALGCGLLLVLVVVGLAVVTASVFLGYRSAYAVRSELDRGYATQDGYTPPATGAIPAERLERFLAVRQALLPLCEKVSAHQQMFARMQGHHDAERAPDGSLVRDAFRMVTSMFRVGRDYGDYVTARNEALLEQRMGLGEYTWIYFVAYHSWLDQPLARAMEGRSKDVYFDRVLPQVREMVRRQVAAMEDVAAAVEWRSELEALDAFPTRVPFEGDLPAELEASLEPFRDELERLACPAASELDVVLTVRSGIGYDHR
jgi:hypothetical protein